MKIISKKFNCKVFLFLMLFYVAMAFAQIDDFVCGHSDEEASGSQSMDASEIMLLKGGRNSNSIINRMEPNPTGRNYKVAVLYFKRNDDTFDASGPAYSDETRCLVNEWPISSAGPNWMGELLITTPYNAFLGLNTSLDIEDNLIEDNSRYGITFVNYSNPLFYDNTIQDNGWDGAYFSTYCEPEFGDNVTTGSGYNEIINNSSDGIWADEYCTVWAGVGDYGVDNAIYGNSDYDVKAESNSIGIAESAYWGQYPPNASQFYQDGTSTILYTFPLDLNGNRLQTAGCLSQSI